MSEWIDVNEKLPEMNKPILFWLVDDLRAFQGSGGSNVFTGTLLDDGWWSFGAHCGGEMRGHKGTITHWMPLPEPPVTA